MRRAARFTAAPVEASSHRVKVQTADGPRWVRVDGAVFAALKAPEAGWIQGNHAGLGVSVLSFGAAAIDVAARGASGTAALMSEVPLGLPVHTPQWTVAAALLRGIGDRRNGRAWTYKGDRDAAALACWQDAAGRAAKRSLATLAWRRRVEAARGERQTAEQRRAARAAGSKRAAKVRQLAAMDSQRAALTAAAVANGTLTND